MTDKLAKPRSAPVVAPSKLVGDVRRLIEAARRRGEGMTPL